MEFHGGADLQQRPLEVHSGADTYLQPMAARGGADVHLQPKEDSTPQQGDAWRRLCPCGKPALEQAPGRICGPMKRGAHTEACFLTGLVTPWGIQSGAGCSWRTVPHGRDLRWSS
ncbi:hypothetical protein AV530_011749 [Patagioenas fasciata monilis]|uniref:Uncharacterized protein n=1 Tax=Patagioenas fasciata monilis TaxID=372326 RepID=A0A1V4KLJ6_PATFA|nr:hypothetical protein AV530_011749 [Patagioenas fasciata monilis]